MPRIAAAILLVVLASCSSPNSDAQYSISGTVDGVTQAGVVLTLAGSASASTTTDSAGSYFFDGLASGTYTVTPAQPTGYAIAPPSLSVTLAGASAFGQNFGCTCSSGYTDCGSSCADLYSDALHCGSCGRGCGLGTCAASQCTCNSSPPTVMFCPNDPVTGTCIDTASDIHNCGGCGRLCTPPFWSANAVCLSGRCRCPPGTTQCGGYGIGTYVCTDLQSDNNNCGQCGNGCTGGRVCRAGQCV
jgi:hypothetical protein